MVKAILENRKSMTRRVITTLPIEPDTASINLDGAGNWVAWAPHPVTDEQSKRCYPNSAGFPCPYGKPGDTLWVKERCAIGFNDDGDLVCDYFADGKRRWFDVTPENEKYSWCYISDDKRPSIFMPRWASRLSLRITDIRAERLQDISEADAKAEGLTSWSNEKQPGVTHYGVAIVDEVWSTDPILVFSHLWDSINAKRGYGWDANPWVWALSFERVTP